MAGGDAPGIVALVELADEHPAAFAYDWRARFGVAFELVGEAMSWGEAVHLLSALAPDPSSHVAAAIAGWQHPLSREALVLADLLDLTAAAHSSKKPKPYPRPWTRADRKPARKQVLSQEQIRAVLERIGPERVEEANGGE